MAEKTLDDIYFAEKQILKALPKMARASQSKEGKQAFLKHKEQTEGQIERLQQVFELIGKPARGKTCEAIQGIIAEAEEIIDEFKGSALDAGLISSAQAVEHYEIARYGTLKSSASRMPSRCWTPPCRKRRRQTSCSASSAKLPPIRRARKLLKQAIRCRKRPLASGLFYCPS
jgi:ferritin-like metal-binding protein YciE